MASSWHSSFAWQIMLLERWNSWLTKEWINQERLWAKEKWREKRQKSEETQPLWDEMLRYIQSRVNLAKRLMKCSVIADILGISDSSFIFTSSLLWSPFPHFCPSESSVIFHTCIVIKAMHINYFKLSAEASFVHSSWRDYEVWTYTFRHIPLN